MTNTAYRIGLGSLCVLSLSLFTVHGSAQSPPTATEAFNLRIKCKKMSDQKAQLDAVNENPNWKPVQAWHSSKYDPTSNRCFGRFYTHATNTVTSSELENDAVWDLQVDDVLASAHIYNGKKHGDINDPDYKKPWLPSCPNSSCPADLGDQTWQAAEDYMSEIMADPRKQ
jgi:hypothetical protein